MRRVADKARFRSGLSVSFRSGLTARTAPLTSRVVRHGGRTTPGNQITSSICGAHMAYGTGIIGCGSIAAAHARGYQAVPGIELALSLRELLERSYPEAAVGDGTVVTL